MAMVVITAMGAGVTLRVVATCQQGCPLLTSEGCTSLMLQGGRQPVHLTITLPLQVL